MQVKIGLHQFDIYVSQVKINVKTVSNSQSINQSIFVYYGMTVRTPSNTQQANTQQFINSSRVLVPSICLYIAFV